MTLQEAELHGEVKRSWIAIKEDYYESHVSYPHLQTKHQKQTQKAAAEIKHQEGPINVSNVMYYDTKAKAPTRIGYKVENGKKVRVAKKTGTVID